MEKTRRKWVGRVLRCDTYLHNGEQTLRCSMGSLTVPCVFDFFVKENL